MKNKLELLLDMTDMTKAPSQVIEESKKELAALYESVEEVKTDIVEEVAENGFKKAHWYNRLWNTIKSLF